MQSEVLHKLPEDPGAGEIAWFENMNPFQQGQTRAQVDALIPAVLANAFRGNCRKEEKGCRYGR